MAKYTPMMEQYLEIKKQNQDCILFYRLGDFMKCFLKMRLLHQRNWKLH